MQHPHPPTPPHPLNCSSTLEKTVKNNKVHSSCCYRTCRVGLQLAMSPGCDLHKNIVWEPSCCYSKEQAGKRHVLTACFVFVVEGHDPQSAEILGVIQPLSLKCLRSLYSTYQQAGSLFQGSKKTHLKCSTFGCIKRLKINLYLYFFCHREMFVLLGKIWCNDVSTWGTLV